MGGARAQVFGFSCLTCVWFSWSTGTSHPPLPRSEASPCTPAIASLPLGSLVPCCHQGHWHCLLQLQDGGLFCSVWDPLCPRLQNTGEGGEGRREPGLLVRLCYVQCCKVCGLRCCRWGTGGRSHRHRHAEGTGSQTPVLPLPDARGFRCCCDQVARVKSVTSPAVPRLSAAGAQLPQPGAGGHRHCLHCAPGPISPMGSSPPSLNTQVCGTISRN